MNATINGLMQAAVEHLKDAMDPPTGCRHAMHRAFDDLLMVCLVHPRSGALCRDCAEDHFARHQAPDGCDLCGLDAETAPVQASAVFPAMVLRHPSGIDKIADVKVSIGASVCRGCLS